LQKYERIKLIPANWTAVQKEIIKPPTYTSGKLQKIFCNNKVVYYAKIVRIIDALPTKRSF